MEPVIEPEELAAACAAVVEKNNLEECYIRPMVLRGYGAAGMNRWKPRGNIHRLLALGTYLGSGALEQGVDVCVSSWQRPEPNTFPSSAKGAGHYNNAQLIKMEAIADGYAEEIAHGPGGLVSEGSGANLFVVRKGVLITPAVDGTLLSGITRDSIITIAGESGIAVREQSVPREALYAADELFFTGTAAEVTPIRSVDRIKVGSGQAGPITLMLQRRFLEVVHGEKPDSYNWLTHVKKLAAIADR